MSVAKNGRRRASGLTRSQAQAAWVLSAPAMILLFVFMILPFLMSVYYSFTNKMLVQMPNNPLAFKGFENYVKVFSNSVAKKAFMNTMQYTLILVPTVLVCATLLAILVNRKQRGVTLFRTIYFSPQVVTMTVVSVIWAFIFSADKNGMLNSVLRVFGMSPKRWLQDPKLAMNCIAVMSIWQCLGMQMIIMLGGLQYIPEELYEAGYIDGCSTLQKFWYITIPMLKNTLVYVLISNTIYSLKLFTQVYVLTEGGPRNATTTVVYLMYETGFTNNQMGYSSALAVVFFIIVLAISLVQSKVTEGD